MWIDDRLMWIGDRLWKQNGQNMAVLRPKFPENVKITIKLSGQKQQLGPGKTCRCRGSATTDKHGWTRIVCRKKAQKAHRF
jgi:hypothetical protein